MSRSFVLRGPTSTLSPPGRFPIRESQLTPGPDLPVGRQHPSRPCCPQRYWETRRHAHGRAAGRRQVLLRRVRVALPAGHHGAQGRRRGPHHPDIHTGRLDQDHNVGRGLPRRRQQCRDICPFDVPVPAARGGVGPEGSGGQVCQHEDIPKPVLFHVM